MAEAVPNIRVTDPHNRDASPLARQDTGKFSVQGEGPPPNGKLAAKLRSPQTSSTQLIEPTSQNESTESQALSEAAMDPLSQRTNTFNALPRLRTQTADNASNQTPTPPNDTYADSKQSEAVREVNGSNNKADKNASIVFATITIYCNAIPALVGHGRDKAALSRRKFAEANSVIYHRKGVSFLSRFIGNKKKGVLDGGGEDGSDIGDTRPEGMDAQLFSHTVDNLGFNPKLPQPPAYIKVRAKFKKEKEFDSLFLAQQLRFGADKNSIPAAGANPAPQSGSAATQNPIWATEFSRDGRFLAAGGQDRIVRVWAVIASSEERRSHEKEESGLGVSEGDATHLSAPVFQQKIFRQYHGHTSTILDLSWSKNNFLLSSSMDKTVRLWHISRNENLCTFKHADFVPSIQFHPQDDRFFLAGSLDSKLRLWSIPDKSVAFWNQLPDMITAVSFTPDGKTCIAGTLGGLCLFYETEKLKYVTQMHVKSTRGQNAKGSKITGIQATHWPPGGKNGDVKLLISSNDSRIRIYNFRDKSLEMKFKGHENNCSQIRATCAEDTGYIICGSEDRKTYIWSTSAPEGEKKQRPLETFDAHNSLTTCAVFAPLKTRQLLSASEDPIFDLCNPPPVTLLSRAESVNSSRAPTDAGSVQPTPVVTESNSKRVAESPAYIARSAHTDGNIIVTADYTGALKVFRQDCAYMKRMRAGDNWDASSVFSRRTGSKLGRPSSIISRGTGRSRRDSTSTQPPNDRIMSWRQDISHGSFDSVNGPAPKRSQARSSSPRKSVGRFSMTSILPAPKPVIATMDTTNPRPLLNPKPSASIDRTPAHSSHGSTPPRDNSQTSNIDPAKQLDLKRQENSSNPLSVYNGQSWAFWNTNTWREQMQRDSLAPPNERPQVTGRLSTVSKLSSELSHEGTEDDDMRCKQCGGDEFKVRVRAMGGSEDKRLVCRKCGTPADS
ncbi:WD40-repeat-containing domain protein [Massariosphaeria phaeospora]|uniref:WD40-repeat-containing domain protein n=1 Tax=Massariosphaeria phaeospora TaxID=100035 RepID=A0A7C8MCS9_9PLEO|nr:WD40-repeat-containing domain protein [Massariosphaeria phaeospora]